MPIHFGDFVLDDSGRQLLRADEPVHISPKAFQLLSILTGKSPQPVSKAELQEELWPGTFVTEGSLATLVTELRSALGDDAKASRFIRTLYGFGYCFAAPVENVIETSQQLRRRPGHLTGAAAFGAIAVVLLLALRSSTAYSPAPQPIRSIAVLPFDTTAAGRNDQHLELGLPDLLITRLSNVREVTVRPTSAIREFAGHRNDAPEIGRKLKVDAVLEGTVRTSPDRVRVTVQLLDVRQRKPIWADRFDEKRADMFAIEDDISERVADAMMVHLTSDEKTLLAKRYTTNPEAYELYIQGRYHLNNGGAGRFYKDDFEKAFDFFQRAVEKDPHYAAAWAGIAEALAAGFVFDRPKFKRSIALPQAESASYKALDLDSSLPDPYATLGLVRALWYFDFEGAEHEYLQALKLNPRHSHALLGYGWMLMCLGRFDESISVSKRLIEVDPLDTNAQWRLANAFLKSGQYDRAMQQIQLILGMDPNHAEAHIGLIRLYVIRGEFDKAIAEARQQAETKENGKALAFLGYALGRAGRQEEARAVLRELTEREPSSLFLLAVVHAGLGDRDEVLTLLEKALDDREYAVSLKVEPVFFPFHSDPRFIALLQRVGLKN